MENPAQVRSGTREEKPPGLREARCGAKLTVAKDLNPHRQEKPLLCIKCPYRKPTQVDEERILRPTEEALSRNSAKWPRNFGRRGALLWRAAENRLKQLFSKNTGLCETER